MAVLAECPICHRRQKTKNKKCVKCEADLDKQKQTGKVKYWVIYRLGGRQIWEPAINEKGENLNITDAKAAEGKRLGQRKEKVITILNIRPQQITFNELVEWYLKQSYVKDRKNKERNLKDFSQQYGTRTVDSILNSDLLNYQARLKNEGKTDATVDNKMSSIKAIVNQALRDKKITREVAETFSSVKKLLKKDPNTGKPTNAKEVTISYETFIALHGAIRERSKDPLKVLCLAGMREAEALNLKWDRVSLEKRLIALHPEDTKERKAKEIPIIEEIYPILQDLYEKAKGEENLGGQKVFAVTKDQFIRDVRKACKKIALTYGRDLKDGFTAHSLRHTFKTNAMRAKISQAVRMRISGHSTPEMDLRYSHPQLDDLRGAMEKISGFMKNGKLKPDAEASPILMAILEEVRSISKSVNKNVSKDSFEQQKEVSEKSANPLN